MCQLAILAFIWLTHRIFARLVLMDTSAEVYRRFGKPHIVDGAVVTFPVITKAIGQAQLLEPVIRDVTFDPGDSLFLATDGMYHVRAFEERMHRAQCAIDLNDAALMLMRECNDEFADNATIAILRRDDFSATGREKYDTIIVSDEDYRQCGQHGHLVGKVLLRKIQDVIASTDFASVGHLLNYQGQLCQTNINIRRRTGFFRAKASNQEPLLFDSELDIR